MKKYFSYFKIHFIIFGLILIMFCFFTYLRNQSKEFIRGNTECKTEQRVFDYADLLTQEEEQELEAMIAIAEKENGLDIVIVNLNRSLEEFAYSYYSYMPIEKYVMVFADEFYEQMIFGYNKPYGDGVILVDNQYREADGYKYLWMGTTGKAEYEYSSEEIDDILIEVEDYVDYNSFRAYEEFIEEVAEFEKKDSIFRRYPELLFYVFVGSIIVSVIFCKGKTMKGITTTVTEHTYVVHTKVNTREDNFIRNSVTKRRISTSSSGSSGGHHRSSRGGGGHHRSRSGRSHGGGGRRRR